MLPLKCKLVFGCLIWGDELGSFSPSPLQRSCWTLSVEGAGGALRKEGETEVVVIFLVPKCCFCFSLLLLDRVSVMHCGGGRRDILSNWKPRAGSPAMSLQPWSPDCRHCTIQSSSPHGLDPICIPTHYFPLDGTSELKSCRMQSCKNSKPLIGPTDSLCVSSHQLYLAWALWYHLLLVQWPD